MSTAKKLDASDERPGQYAEFRKLLLERRTELLNQNRVELGQLDKQTMESPGDVGDVSVVDANADYFLTLAEGDRRELTEIRDALTRMQHGVYGTCENCESEIPIERLRKLPQARRCVDCQSTMEVRYRTSHLNPTPKL